MIARTVRNIESYRAAYFIISTRRFDTIKARRHPTNDRQGRDFRLPRLSGGIFEGAITSYEETFQARQF